jgi:hypothetical protein
MCIFTGPVLRVDTTKIFARFMGPGRQCLVYSMSVGAAADVAMVLPIPVVAGSGDDAVSFVNLERYPELFDDIKRLFPMPASGGIPQHLAQNSLDSLPLVVHKVGAFEASFVPTLADFDRLDPRFRLPEGVWQRLPQYNDWGFVVFKLQNLSADATTKIHPMAFEFDSRVADVLFFPTVHVHDGDVHERARFAHDLYFQVPSGDDPLYQEMRRASAGFFPGTGSVGTVIDLERAQGLIAPDQQFHHRGIHGQLLNADVWTRGDMLPQAPG